MLNSLLVRPAFAARVCMTGVLGQNYLGILSSLKNKIRSIQIRTSLSVNAHMIRLYWEIGRIVFVEQKKHKWGDKIIRKLSHDLQLEFSGMKGLSYRNILYMKRFYQEYPSLAIVQQLAAQLPWWHNVILLTKVKNKNERIWYSKQTIENGWSRAVLLHQLESKLYQRQIGNEKTTNFKETLPLLQSELAEQMIKDPYKLDFLSAYEIAKEQDLENELVKHIRKFLMELGAGFAFVGQQYHLEIGQEDYYIDLLFYHLKLRCYVVIELKIGKFRPEYVGKLNFYLSAVDDVLRHRTDNASIGILLCKSKDKITAEYALKDISKPVGICEYKITKAIPKELKGSLPSIEDIEKEFSNKKVNKY